MFNYQLIVYKINLKKKFNNLKKNFKKVLLSTVHIYVKADGYRIFAVG